MTFGEAVRHVFANLNNFEGRARRAEFWWFYLFLQLVSLGLGIVMFILMFAVVAGTAATASSDAEVGAFLAGYGLIFVVWFLLSLAMVYVMLAVEARRLHDIGQSAHWLWLHLAGAGIVPLVMCIMEGEPHANQYGPDPKAHERYYGPGGPMAGPPGGYGYPPAASEGYAAQPGSQPPPPAPPGPPADPFAAPPASGATPPAPEPPASPDAEPPQRS